MATTAKNKSDDIQNTSLLNDEEMELLNSAIEDQVKSVQLHIRLTEDEKRLVRRASSLKGKTMSEFLRETIMITARQITQRADEAVYLVVDGEYVFSARPRVHVFSNLFKLTKSQMELNHWANLYGIPAEHIKFVLDQIGSSGVLHKKYMEWLDAPEDEPEEF